MTDHNIRHIRPPNKLRKLDVELRITAASEPAGRLSPTERLIAAYAIAEHAGVALAENSDLSLGLKNVMNACWVHLLNRDGEKRLRDFLNLLCGMAGGEFVERSDDPGMPIDENTDWSEISLR